MSANPSWEKLERLVAAIHHAESHGAIVTWNDKIQGRQFDVTLRFKYGLHEYLTVIECKDYKDKIPVEKIDAFVTKARDINANKAVIVSTNGYQSGCFDVAKRHGVKLLTINEKVEIDLSSLASEVTPALNIFDVRLLKSDGKEIILEDAGGRLHYLMKHIRLSFDGKQISPNQLISMWQLKSPKLNFDIDSFISLPLPQNTIADIPYEGKENVKEIRFKCKIVKAFIPNGPVLDMHVLEGMATRYDLLNEAGEIEHTARLSELNLGFDTVPIPGKFYAIPRLHNYYYCDSINDDTVTWILIESYQHGDLLQATLTQDIKYAHYYIEVTEKTRLERLRKMLTNYKSSKKEDNSLTLTLAK